MGIIVTVLGLILHSFHGINIFLDLQSTTIFRDLVHPSLFDGRIRLKTDLVGGVRRQCDGTYYR